MIIGIQQSTHSFKLEMYGPISPLSIRIHLVALDNFLKN